MSCKHDCAKPAIFPKTIFNRPALENIDYKIGTYSRMREYMFDLLNKNTTLESWTHRGADDPGIAMLEGNAIVADILTFYQNLYANESFLRTANWRESVGELVKLMGYRLAPGVGGEGIFAVKVKGGNAVTVPKGFGFKAQLENRDKQDEFESTITITAYPHLSEFNLYRPARGMQSILADGISNQLELHAVDGSNDLSSLQSVEIKEGDRIMLVPDSSMFDEDCSYKAQAKPEIVIVDNVETIMNRIIISFEGALTVNRGSTIKAYIIDRTFRHFGYQASFKLNKFDGTSVTQENTEFGRLIHIKDSGSDYYSELAAEDIPLDQEVGDIAVGRKLICQSVLMTLSDVSSSPWNLYYQVPFIVVKDIGDIEVNTLRWSNIQSAATVLKINEPLITNHEFWDLKIDIRKTLFHEVISRELTLRAPPEFTDGDFSDGELEYFGTYDEVKALAERQLLLVDAEDDLVQAVKTTSKLANFATQLSTRDQDNKWRWTVTLDQKPEFKREAFDQVNPKITVYGNPVHANQGKSEKEVALGSGDNREVFQTFKLPKAPLTYLLDETQTPAQVPELKIYVEGILWKRVDDFFKGGADDQVYVIREDADGNSYVQFGDGKTGSRLPSGKNNVRALFRTGIGAAGVLDQGKNPLATGKLKELEKVFLPDEVVGGDEAESQDKAREAAPGRMQSLGRLVGLADFEAEALSVPGVLRVIADWAAPDGVPLVRVVVLTESGTKAAVEKVQDTLNTYNRCRGPARFPIEVEQGLLQFLYINLRVSYQASRREKDIEKSVKIALGVVGEEENGIETDQGLFSIKHRQFGQGVHWSQIIATVQNVEGVTWVEIDDAQAINLGIPPETDPTNLVDPPIESTNKRIGCLPTRILALHTIHFDLSLAADDTKRGCDL